jgi:poly(A) polymerase
VKSSPNLANDLREFKAAGALTLAIPEFADTWGPRGEQSPDWHPEGNVWTHTLMVVESLPQDASYGLKLAAIFHDIGKPATFFKYPTSGGITFAGHAQVGAEMLRRVIGPRLGIDPTILEHAATIVEYHMFMHDFFKPERVGPEFQRHILNLPCIRDLIMIQHADVSGTGISLERKKESSHQSKLLRLVAELPHHS